MPFVTRLAVAVLLFAAACVLAGTYGMLHNQVSYTVAPEYFTKFKFDQFRTPPALPDRVAAAIVGWRASFGVGGLVALFVVPAAYAAGDVRSLIRLSLRGFAITLAVAAAIGLLALAVSFVMVREDNVPAIVERYGNIMDDPVAFWRAGTMHNFSYLGGAIGSCIGCVMTVRAARQVRKKATTGEPPDTITPG